MSIITFKADYRRGLCAWRRRPGLLLAIPRPESRQDIPRRRLVGTFRLVFQQHKICAAGALPIFKGCGFHRHAVFAPRGPEINKQRLAFPARPSAPAPSGNSVKPGSFRQRGLSLAGLQYNSAGARRQQIPPCFMHNSRPKTRMMTPKTRFTLFIQRPGPFGKAASLAPATGQSNAMPKPRIKGNASRRRDSRRHIKSGDRVSTVTTTGATRRLLPGRRKPLPSRQSPTARRH